MDKICKYNKYGHCKYGKFCNFAHENRKCETKFCDFKKCDKRHPKNCKYVVNNKPCKFGEFCSFEHGFENLLTVPEDASENRMEDKIKKLEAMIVTKDSEIEYLRKVINNWPRRLACAMRACVRHA